MTPRTVVVLAALLVSSAAQSNFFTYQSWLTLPESARAMYISGAYDSLITFNSDEQDQKVSSHYARCISAAKMGNGQLAANVINFARDKPDLQVGPVQAH
jgi:hypothetical protein